MVALLAFAVTLFAAVLISERAERALHRRGLPDRRVPRRPGVFELVTFDTQNRVVSQFAELALFSVLFTDGVRVGLRNLASAWRLPGQALLSGMPLTMAGVAVLGRLLVGLPWSDALLL